MSAIGHFKSRVLAAALQSHLGESPLDGLSRLAPLQMVGTRGWTEGGVWVLHLLHIHQLDLGCLYF